MSYADATAFAASLADTLMVEIVVFQAGDGTHGACPAAEFDGDNDMVKLELDPWALGTTRASFPPPGSRLIPRPGVRSCDDRLSPAAQPGTRPGQRGRVRAVRP